MLTRTSTRTDSSENVTDASADDDREVDRADDGAPVSRSEGDAPVLAVAAGALLELLGISWRRRPKAA
jgi:hypothetical protein